MANASGLQFTSADVIELTGITTKATLADAFSVALERTGRSVQKSHGQRAS